MGPRGGDGVMDSLNQSDQSYLLTLASLSNEDCVNEIQRELDGEARLKRKIPRWLPVCVARLSSIVDAAQFIPSREVERSHCACLDQHQQQSLVSDLLDSRGN